MTDAPDDLSQQRAQIGIALGRFAMLTFAGTGVIAWTNANPGGKVLGALKSAQIDAHLRDKAHCRHRLHAWMRHQELHHRLLGLHLRFDLLEERLAWRPPRTADGRRDDSATPGDAVGSALPRLLAPGGVSRG